MRRVVQYGRKENLLLVVSFKLVAACACFTQKRASCYDHITSEILICQVFALNLNWFCSNPQKLEQNRD